MRNKNRFGSNRLGNLVRFEKSKDCTLECRNDDATECEFERNTNWQDDELKDGLVTPCPCTVCHRG
jgi:hypothetical protein